MTDLFRILVVCTGNVCRSPMAEGFLTLLIHEEGLHQIVAESAGLHAPEGCTPTSHALEAAAELGADIRDHHAVYLDRRAVLEADLILVMEKDHERQIQRVWPEESAGKVRLIRSFHPNSPALEDVTDPIGATLPFYHNVARLLMACCYGVIHHVKEILAGRKE